MLTPRPRRRAFTLAEVLVSLALIAMLAAVLTPTIRGRMQDSYEDALIAEFDNLASAITAYRQDVGHYPPFIDYLSQLRSPALDRCGVPLSAAAKANWRGPYITRQVINTGINPVYIFAQKDTFFDSLYTASGPTGIAIRVTGPDPTTAQNLDIKIDGRSDNTTGTLQYTAQTFGPGAIYTDELVSYIIPTKSGTC